MVLPQRLFIVVLFVAAVSCGFVASRSDSPESPPVSSFAPQADLLAQVDFFIGRVEESLADPQAFDLAKQARTLKDGNTLAVLALVLSQHDAGFPEKSSMPSLLKAAQSLAAAGDDAAKAKSALQEIQTARAGKSHSRQTVKWERVASLPALMKQVPLIHAGLKRGATPARLKKTTGQSAGQAAALAAVAQASMFDDEYAKDPADVAAWRKFCVDMRDAAGDVNSAVHAGDQSRVDAGMKKMLESCEACHAKFR